MQGGKEFPDWVDAFGGAGLQILLAARLVPESPSRWQNGLRSLLLPAGGGRRCEHGSRDVGKVHRSSIWLEPVLLHHFAPLLLEVRGRLHRIRVLGPPRDRVKQFLRQPAAPQSEGNALADRIGALQPHAIQVQCQPAEGFVIDSGVPAGGVGGCWEESICEPGEALAEVDSLADGIFF